MEAEDREENLLTRLNIVLENWRHNSPSAHAIFWIDK